ncbi:hypothetical protein [Primorskyibacter sp. S87]|uniref:hypothetical protein n=1 Tax=Primorskyibacter sp. S87 TaxID=3415126 RepID=UPI003C7A5D17
MQDGTENEILATVEASVPRRWFAMAMLVGLGATSLYVSFSTPPALGWQLFLIAVGVISLWAAMRLWQATSLRIELTDTELRCSDGTMIAEVADIVAMDRGFFAFKPSNGFLIKTGSACGARTWRPGLWWRMGRRIGIGGVTPGSQTKFMSETIAAMMAKRDGAF